MPAPDNRPLLMKLDFKNQKTTSLHLVTFTDGQLAKPGSFNFGKHTAAQQQAAGPSPVETPLEVWEQSPDTAEVRLLDTKSR
jgi:hypothetical protein